MAEQVRVITNITKEYPEMFKVTVFKKPKYYFVSQNPKRDRESVTEDYIPRISSLNRTKQTVRDIVLCNDFELFCTFTFDPKKVDSFNMSACWQKMSTWLHHQSNISREQGIKFKYLIIPERHKSGRWHYHALLSGYLSTLKPTKLVTPSLNPIFNITSFRSGFTTAVRIETKEGVSNYITKYITKDFIKTFNSRRFFCSRGLIRPNRELNSNVIRNTLPLFRKQVLETSDSYSFVIYK